MAWDFEAEVVFTGTYTVPCMYVPTWYNIYLLITRISAWRFFGTTTGYTHTSYYLKLSGNYTTFTVPRRYTQIFRKCTHQNLSLFLEIAYTRYLLQ
tara:strand:- start:158 stop:445 length:288 start_codon:yes stop_codon:yes gene_type:complete